MSVKIEKMIKTKEAILDRLMGDEIIEARVGKLERRSVTGDELTVTITLTMSKEDYDALMKSKNAKVRIIPVD